MQQLFERWTFSHRKALRWGWLASAAGSHTMAATCKHCQESGESQADALPLLPPQQNQ
jgi:hypothetical protein